ncbi:MAG: hypothetical protein JNL73_24760 [Anaerolineales bacterium]|nr:hypothetical protein [Anaerolineales bacterium]
MNPSKPGGLGFGAGYLIFVVLAALALIALGFEGTYLLVNLRAVDEGMTAAADASAQSVDRAEQNGYAVLTLRTSDGPEGLSALSAAQSELEARGLSDRVQVRELLLVDDVVVLRAEFRLPALAGRLLGLSSYDYLLTTLAEVSP